MQLLLITHCECMARCPVSASEESAVVESANNQPLRLQRRKAGRLDALWLNWYLYCQKLLGTFIWNAKFIFFRHLGQVLMLSSATCHARWTTFTLNLAHEARPSPRHTPSLTPPPEATQSLMRRAHRRSSCNSSVRLSSPKNCDPTKRRDSSAACARYF